MLSLQSPTGRSRLEFNYFSNSISATHAAFIVIHIVRMKIPTYPVNSRRAYHMKPCVCQFINHAILTHTKRYRVNSESHIKSPCEHKSPFTALYKPQDRLRINEHRSRLVYSRTMQKEVAKATSSSDCTCSDMSNTPIYTYTPYINLSVDLSSQHQVAPQWVIIGRDQTSRSEVCPLVFRLFNRMSCRRVRVWIYSVVGGQINKRRVDEGNVGWRMEG